MRPHGTSMEPEISSGQLVTVLKMHDPGSLRAGDIVLATVCGTVRLHQVLAVDYGKKRVLIGNAKGHVNGWTGWNKVWGRYVPFRTHGTSGT
jgi:Peptidase S24-like